MCRVLTNQTVDQLEAVQQIILSMKSIAMPYRPDADHLDPVVIFNMFKDQVEPYGEDYLRFVRTIMDKQTDRIVRGHFITSIKFSYDTFIKEIAKRVRREYITNALSDQLIKVIKDLYNEYPMFESLIKDVVIIYLPEYEVLDKRLKLYQISSRSNMRSEIKKIREEFKKECDKPVEKISETIPHTEVTTQDLIQNKMPAIYPREKFGFEKVLEETIDELERNIDNVYFDNSGVGNPYQKIVNHFLYAVNKIVIQESEIEMYGTGYEIKSIFENKLKDACMVLRKARFLLSKKESPDIHVTKDYDKFKVLEKAINADKLINMKEKLKNGETNNCVIVNNNFEIIDGVYYFSACRDLGLEVNYTVIDKSN